MLCQSGDTACLADTIAIFLCICLSVCLCKVWGGLGMRQWFGSWYVWLVEVSWFVRLLTVKGSQVKLVLSTVEAHFSLH